MELGKVVGQVVSTVRDPGLPNLKFLLVDIVDAQGKVTCPGQVAADILGAGEGEMVLLVRGSSASMVLEAKNPAGPERRRHRGPGDLQEANVL